MLEVRELKAKSHCRNCDVGLAVDVDSGVFWYFHSGIGSMPVSIKVSGEHHFDPEVLTEWISQLHPW